jgi:hypothetical protein
MPAGKLGPSGGHSFILPLPYTVNVRSLRKRAKRTTPPPTVRDLRECRRILRKSVSIYRIACATPQPTATEQRRSLSMIKTAARRFIKGPSKAWADKLLNYLEAADANSRSIINREVIAHGHPSNALITTKRLLRELFLQSIYPDEAMPTRRDISRASADKIQVFRSRGYPVVRLLADMEIDALVPGSGRWPDPALANLVANLQPLWRRITGRTAALISKDKVGELKQCHFADWLGELLERAGLPRPPVGRVVDIVCPQKKSKIRRPTG